MNWNSIAIDGPSGAGKSTLARELARALGYVYIDTGAIYRTVGLYAARQGVDTKNAEAVLSRLHELDIQLTYEAGVQHIFLNGEDVSEAIRTEEASRHASEVSAIPGVRAFLLDLQRNMTKKQHVIMDGRDIGTVVLPDASVKIFLTASPEARAKRRYEELLAKGEPVTYASVYENLVRRDEIDSTRAAAPLRASEDAIMVDTTNDTPSEALARLKQVIEEKLYAL
ncbi:MAG: cytidylate kinase [Clostridium sp. SCN 57-10]|nr:MAG: cytidylate kinase [Clostridium sp. SCN 57-10]